MKDNIYGKNRLLLGRRSFLEAASLTSMGILLASPVKLLAQDIRELKPSPVVKTSHGSVRGLTRLGNTYSFFGIPYGADTGGAGRFMPKKE